MTSLKPVVKKRDQDPCFTSMVHYIKLFAPTFLGAGQEKHTTAVARKRGRVCGVWVCVVCWGGAMMLTEKELPSYGLH